jgi:CO/xanthine dehydrogenase FAD-binding subunit
VVDINSVSDFVGIRDLKNSLLVGAIVRQCEALESPHVLQRVPLLAEALPYVGHYQTRNRGTLCGSIAHADPSAELPLVLLVLGGKVHLESKQGRRAVSATDFFLGSLTTARRPDEIIVAAEWPIAEESGGFSFDEIGAHEGHFALVACAVAVSLDPAARVRALTVGLAGVGDSAILVDTWPYLGLLPDEAWQRSLVDRVRTSVRFPEDLHASSAYRQHVAGVLVESCLLRALAKASTDAKGGSQ